MKITATDALFGFGAWLTCRKQPVTFSHKHDAGKMVELIGEFISINDLPDPSEGYPDNFIMPKS